MTTFARTWTEAAATYGVDLNAGTCRRGYIDLGDKVAFAMTKHETTKVLDQRISYDNKRYTCTLEKSRATDQIQQGKLLDIWIKNTIGTVKETRERDCIKEVVNGKAVFGTTSYQVDVDCKGLGFAGTFKLVSFDDCGDDQITLHYQAVN